MEMIEPTFVTWAIAIFGAITFFPLMGAQLSMLFNPQGQKTKDLIIGKGQDWRDKTHFKSALAFAWADIILLFPIFICGNIGVFLGQLWGYVLWFALGILSIYFSILFWVMEKEYTYPSCGWLAYFTYYWGFFLYWGIIAVVYSISQIV